VRIYREVLSCSRDEQILAVYPEKIIMPLVARVKVLLTCGLEYLLHWRRKRREGAIILTDRRVIQVSSCFMRNSRSLKVDMFTVGPTVKYVSLTPSRRLLCQASAGSIIVSSQCGGLELSLVRMWHRQQCALQLWLGLELMQDAPPIASVQLGDWITVVEGLPEDEQMTAEAGGEAMEIARRESVGLWGPSGIAAAAAAAAAAVPGSDDGESSTSTPRERPTSEGAGPFRGTLPVSDERVRAAREWGLVLGEDEQVLWGPCLFEEEVVRLVACSCRRKIQKCPATLVAITDRRVVITQFQSQGLLGCRGLCHRAYITSVTVVPLRWVLGFSIDEAFATQRNAFAYALARCFCRSTADSVLVVRILSNVGFGKVYLSSLRVWQCSLPRAASPTCSFEEDRVLELRRWLGNVAMFFSEEEHRCRSDSAAHNGSRQLPIELWRCARGWTP